MSSKILWRNPLIAICLVPMLAAQDTVTRPIGTVFVRPYKPAAIPPVRLANSSRLASLMRAGKLYLTVADAIAVAIENNLDLEVARYSPLLAEWAIERAEAGGPIRGVPSAPALVSGVDSGLGVNGSALSAGLSSGTSTVQIGAAGGASIQQIGPITQILDPMLQNTTTFSHLSQPQANQLVSQTNALIQTTHNYNTVLTQGLLTGGYVQFRDYEQYLKENAPSDALNPGLGPYFDLYLQHNLLQGLGSKVNGRGIRIAKRNREAAPEMLRAQLLALVADVLNLYWDLVTANEQLQEAQRSLDVAQKFYDDTATEVRLSALPGIELPRAQAEVASRRQDVILAQEVVRNGETSLKQVLTRTLDPTVDDADIVLLDSIQVPQTEELPPLRELVQRAMAKRPDVALSKISDETAAISAVGTENGLLPTMQGYIRTRDRGAAGTAQPGNQANPYFVGGYGTALGQIARRDFPNNIAGAFISIPLRNRQAQGDYGVDQLQLRQSDVRGRKAMDQIIVDISLQTIAVRQARARYAAAVSARELNEQLLTAEQTRFAFGSSSLSNMILTQRAVLAGQSAETDARSAYVHARIALDQVLGETLEVNHISIDEGLSGRVAKESKLP
ncbi:MAG TPA: TolC family protein [Bryobacteraceae bacterium]|nr:TolC family protein [Bryobacteraceae bacterium]